MSTIYDFKTSGVVYENHVSLSISFSFKKLSIETLNAFIDDIEGYARDLISAYEDSGN